jgi:rubrerythrin
MTKAMIEIARPYCDWISVAHRDKRRGKVWLCHACGHMEKGKEVPKCPCKPMEIAPAAP